MIVVMPLGYGTMEIITCWSVDHTDVRDKNSRSSTRLCSQLGHAKVEGEYRVRSDRNSRAIAGFDGGSESLLTGLNNLDKFAWIALQCGECPTTFKRFSFSRPKANQQLRLLWDCLCTRII